MIADTRRTDRTPDLGEMIRRRDMALRRLARHCGVGDPHKDLRRLIKLRERAMRSATRPGEA